MTATLITNFAERQRVASLLRSIAQTLMFPGMAQRDRDIVEEHLRWLGRHNLRATCKLETFPVISRTMFTITLDAPGTGLPERMKS